MPFNIVLVEPEIPNNTGNIGRLCLAAGATLHLVKPLGFSLDDKQLKRAGLDYWPHLSVIEHESLDHFLAKHGNKPMAFFSSHSKHSYLDAAYAEDMFLIFGKESVGLPKPLLEANKAHSFHIPIHSEHVRSLNLANAVSIVLFEGQRQLA